MLRSLLWSDAASNLARRVSGVLTAGLLISGAARAAIVVDPLTPTTSDVVRITASGGMPNPCYDVASTVAVRGRVIAITVDLRAQPVVCIQVLGSWQVSHEVGPLAEGRYRVEVAAGGLPRPAGAFQAGTLTVVAAGGAPGLEVAACPGDCDGDGVVRIAELTRGVGAILGFDSIPAALDCPALQPVAIDGLIRAVGAALRGCPPPRVVDFSGFTAFELFRGTGYGFCPPLGSTMAASIRRLGDGSYLLKRSFLELGERGVDACVVGPFLADDCYVSRVQPCRTLTGEEVERVRTAAGALTVLPGPVLGCGFEDPCLMTWVRWDDALLGDGACSSLRLMDADGERLVALLDSLGEGPERPCPRGLCGPGDFALCNDGNRADGDGCSADCVDELSEPGR